MKTLTAHQLSVIQALRDKGADFTANATKQAWECGEAYYLDTRNPSRKGMVRAFNKGNKQATGALK
jgi:hypothetical protein